MQLVKGRFSFRLQREFEFAGEVWQRGFSEVQVMNRENYENHRKYIAENPVKARLVDSPEQFPFCYRSLATLKAAHKASATGAVQQGLKPTFI